MDIKPRIITNDELKSLKKSGPHLNRKTRRRLGNPEEIKAMKQGFALMKEKKTRAAVCVRCHLRPRANGSSRCAGCTNSHRAKVKKV